MAEINPDQLATGTVPAAEVLTAVMRSIAALCSLAVPLKSYPGLLDFLREVRPPDQPVRPADHTLRDLTAVRDFASRGLRRVLWEPAPRRPIINAYCDACTDGRWAPTQAGWGLIARGECPAGVLQAVASCAFPAAWARVHINYLELWGLLLTVCLGTRWPGAAVHIRSDSAVVVGWVNSNRAGDALVCAVVRYMRLLLESSHCALFLSHVPGTANIADGPSRGDPANKAALVQVPWPADPADAARRHAALGHAQWIPEDRVLASAFEGCATQYDHVEDDEPSALALRFACRQLCYVPTPSAPLSVPLLAPQTGEPVSWPTLPPPRPPCLTRCALALPATSPSALVRLSPRSVRGCRLHLLCASLPAWGVRTVSASGLPSSGR